MKDLTKSKVDLQSYTLKAVMGVVPLVENHLSELLALSTYLGDEEKFDQAWQKTLFCRECILRHAQGEISGYGLECIRGSCTPLESWKRLAALGSEIYDYFEPLREKQHYTGEVFDKTQEFLTRLRSVRKELTGDDGIRNGHIID